jgi:outer membrane protein assembly factor BamB
MGLLLPPRVSSIIAAAVAWLPCFGLADCGGGSLCGTPADEFVADRAGLVREWVVQLPFDSGGWQLEHVTVGDGLVVAQTNDGGVHAVSAAPDKRAGQPFPGSVLWSQRIGIPGGPATPPGIGPGLVTVARDQELYALERGTGRILWRDPFGQLPAAGATAIGDWVYAPLTDGSMKRLTVNPLQPTAETVAAAAAKQKPQPRKTAAAARKKDLAAAKPTQDSLRPRALDGGGRLERTVLPLGGGVAWSTADGLLVSLVQVDDTWGRFEFDLRAPAVDSPVTRGGSIFAATVAGDLARIDLVETGLRGLRAGWHTILDAIPDAGPFLSGDTVVVSLGESGLAAYSAETGELKWRNCIAGRVLSIAGDRIWIIDRVGRLSGIDLATGDRLERLCLGGFSFPVVNMASDRLVLASPDGLLVSLAPKRPLPAPAPAAKPAAAAPVAEGQP